MMAAKTPIQKPPRGEAGSIEKIPDKRTKQPEVLTQVGVVVEYQATYIWSFIPQRKQKMEW